MPSPLAVLRRLPPLADADALSAYARTRDPLLLAELVRRHGGLVWGVCRRALPHRPDAEDAYQATWLVLAQNPAAVRTPAALPGFLHTVAVRTCRRVRSKRPRVADAGHLPARDPTGPDSAALAVLDAELARLPDRLRRPLVLHHLDGRTQDDAAAALGLSRSTLKRRLAAGRELLRARLAGRGVDLGAALAAAGGFGLGPPLATAGGVAATALSTEVLAAMWTLKLKLWAAGLVVTAGLATTGGGLLLADGPPGHPGSGPGVVEVPGGGPVPGLGFGPEPRATGPNFEVTAPTPGEAEQIRRAAEQARRELAVRWLGRELPPWDRRCVVTYKLSRGGADAGGATHFTFTNDGASSMRMELFGALPKLLADVLPHEVMHTVLATELKRAVPRWADEGIAVLAESPASQQAHAARTAELLNQGRAIPLRVLLPLTDYPKDMHTLFAQGHSVCRFLRDREPTGGERKLLDFVRRGMADEWEPAAKAVYGFADFDAMQAAWIASLRGPTAVGAEVPAAPPPADPVRAAYDQQAAALEKAAAAADEAAVAQGKIADQYRAVGGGVSEEEKLGKAAQAAKSREAAAQHRVELAKVRVEIAKLGAAPPPAPAPAAPAVPPRLIKERLDTARRFLVLDREMRQVGAISREEAPAAVSLLSDTATELYAAAVDADPTPTGRLAAAREWYVTARDAELYYKARAERGLDKERTALPATLARNRAERVLWAATAAAPLAVRDGIAPFAAAPTGYAGKAVGVQTWLCVQPAAGLKPLAALRVRREGKPVGVLVVIAVSVDGGYGLMLPNPDGGVPELRAGDEVRP